MRYFLDTNICIYIINQHPPNIIAKFTQFDPYEIGISAIVVSELQYGVAKSSQPQRNQQRLDAFLMPFQVVPYDTAPPKPMAQFGQRWRKVDSLLAERIY
jgi:tRNA(fMet)-specific endonuclease VapC